MMRTANASSRLWVGPMMLVIIIALIYLLSLMPAAPPMSSNGLLMAESHPEFSIKGQPHKGVERYSIEPVVSLKQIEDDACQPNGYTNSTEGGCRCRKGYSGDRCEIMSCENNGTFNETLGRCECFPPFYGKTCAIKCHGSFDPITGICECPTCSKRCINGHLVENSCVCFQGFTGPSCSTCMSPTGCDEIGRRRGAVNSRLTLSGLSFCIITIGLLCVGARRRRSQMAPMSDETWYRVFHPNNNRPFRCRHDYMCGGSWVPRDRALIVAPGRVSMSSTAPRIHRLATPPPSYTSVDEAGDLQTLPPTYEEATRIEIVDEEQEIVEQVVEEQKETTSDEQVENRQTDRVEQQEMEEVREE